MRKLDSKFHIEGDMIVKTSNGDVIPEDEPVFLLRARDILAISLLRCYSELSHVAGCNSYHFDKLSETIDDFKRFQALHPGRMKQPSVTRGL